MGYFLQFLDGDREGEVVPLEENRIITFGRDPDNTIHLPDRKLSRIHCQIHLKGSDCILTDLNSTNGTFVNGKRTERQIVKPGDVVQIGLTRFLVGFREDEPAATSGHCVECGGAVSADMLRSGEARRVGKRLYCPRCRATFPTREATSATAQPREIVVDLKPNDAVGEMRILEKLGDGFFGPYFKAERPDLARPLFLLVLNVGTRDWQQRFLQAVFQAGRVIHPNVLLTCDAAPWRDTAYVSWEYTSGRVLTALGREREGLSLAAAGALVAQIAEALEAAAEQQISHGLLCPPHVLVNKQERVKVFGFGLGSLPLPVGIQRLSLAALPYLPPERLADGGAVDGRADVYSLGAIFLFLLTGRPPFEGGTSEEITAQICAADARELLTERLSLVPDSVRCIIERCMASSPTARFARPKDFLEELNLALRGAT